MLPAAFCNPIFSSSFRGTYRPHASQKPSAPCRAFPIYALIMDNAAPKFRGPHYSNLIRIDRETKPDSSLLPPPRRVDASGAAPQGFLGAWRRGDQPVALSPLSLWETGGGEGMYASHPCGAASRSIPEAERRGPQQRRVPPLHCPQERRHILVRRPPLDLPRAAHLPQPSADDDRHAVGEPRCLLQVVRHEHGRVMVLR